MKSINKLFILLFVAILGISSCDLERFPKDALDFDNSLESVNQASNWNEGFDIAMRAITYGGYSTLQDIQADQLNASASYGNNQGFIYTWQNLNSSDPDLSGIWAELYAILKNPNSFLRNIDKLKIDNQRDKDLVNAYTANALVLRSYIYSMLATRYGLRYNKSTASTDLCVPLVLEFDVEGQPARSTNEAVYNQILSDIDRAIKLYSEIQTPDIKAKYQGQASSSIMTMDVAIALKARVLLYMEDWDAAYKLSEELISTGRYPLVSPSQDSFINMWVLDQSSEDIYTCFLKNPDELPNVNGYFAADITSPDPNNPNYQLGVCKPNYLPTKGIIELFEDSDLRKGVYFDSSVLTDFNGSIYDYGQVTVISKFRGNPNLATVAKSSAWGDRYFPNGRQAPKVFRIAETYLIAAEAAFNMGDETNAKKYLNELRTSRGLIDITSSGDLLRDEIRNERTRELAFEGFRLWDIRRWGLPLKRMPVQTLPDGTSPFLASLGQDLEVPNDSPFFVWPIPYNDIQNNPNIRGQQNPGW